MTRILALALLGFSMTGAPVLAGHTGCPPGLAKKHNGCMPPGLAKKQGIYHPGDIIYGDYIILRHPGRHGLDPRHTYYRVGDHIYRVDRDTRKVLDLIGAAAAVLN